MKHRFFKFLDRLIIICDKITPGFIAFAILYFAYQIIINLIY